eukprot:CAMPEP_0115335404 /NCGR_PEP_ID=MMETSP0270-20121206/88436_1 /TAXON_ID=71861 /ORGANISM="Scrippsiella trochoidea, Strain CCMP3099" /LENGTH=82 /DNA_ID=CAMNT_0002756471 /DNA_START=87 /DNA_END=332 /DNA_ORIENTATION=-
MHGPSTARTANSARRSPRASSPASAWGRATKTAAACPRRRTAVYPGATCSTPPSTLLSQGRTKEFASARNRPRGRRGWRPAS